jgi:hypothetical protein
MIIVGAESRKNIDSSEDPKQAYSTRRGRIESELVQSFGPNHPFTVALRTVDKTGVLDSIDSYEDAREQASELIESDISLLRRLMSPA